MQYSLSSSPDEQVKFPDDEVCIITPSSVKGIDNQQLTGTITTSVGLVSEEIRIKHTGITMNYKAKHECLVL